jgi:hypothetical protein
MNASIDCAILKKKSGAPKEKIKGVSKTVGGSVASKSQNFISANSEQRKHCNDRLYDRRHQGDRQ